jgi:hypothetical protein
MERPVASPAISVAGNVEGSIVIGDNNFVVNNNYGTLVYKQAGPQVRLREMAPKPPRAPRSFFGRSRELALLNQHILNRDPVLLEGLDGIGKSYLVKQAANGAEAQAQPNGVIYLEGVDQAGAALGLDDLQQLLFDALFESEPQLKVTSASARTYLSNTTPLILLDNLKLNEDALDRLADLFPKAPILAVTSQNLESEAFETIKLAPLELAEATQLLAARAKIDLEEADPLHLEKICTLLNRMPVAIVTVANVIREQELDLAEATLALTQIQTAAAQPNKAAVERSLKFANSYLTDDERQMVAMTAAVPGVSAGRGWLENSPGGQAASQKLENLGLLQANSPRLRLHPEYAALALDGVDADAIRVDLLDSLNQSLRARSLDFAFVKDELGNILGMLDWAAEQERWADVVAICRGVDAYLILRGVWSAWRHMMERALQAAQALGDRAVEAWARHQLGTLAIGTGELQAAAGQLKQALHLREALGDEVGMAYTQHNLDFLGGLIPPQDHEPPRRPPGTHSAWTTVIRTALMIVILSGAVLAGLISMGQIRPSLGLLAPALERTVPAVLAAPPASETPTETSTNTPLPTSTATATVTETATETTTPTLEATPTLTDTPSATPTDTLTPTLTLPAVPVAVVNVGQAYCPFGPSYVYLSAVALVKGDIGMVQGRDYAGTWLYVKLEKNGQWCWVDRYTVDVTGDISKSPVTQPVLPISNVACNPAPIHATRDGLTVTLTWTQCHVNLRDARGYLLEVQICQNTILFPVLVTTDANTYSFTDQKGCAAPSKGVLYSVDVRGYSAPYPIPWAPNP